MMALSFVFMSFPSSFFGRFIRVSGYLIVMLSLSQLACAFVVPTLLVQAGADSPPHLHQVKAPESKGAVASESSICSNIGLDLIKQGGNAADAVSAGFR